MCIRDRAHTDWTRVDGSNMQDLVVALVEGRQVKVESISFTGLVNLKEDDLRAFCKTHDWSQYAGKFVSVHCSADAIIPTWAYMLVASHLQPHATFITEGDADQLERAVFTRFVQHLDVLPYSGARVVVKGCSKSPVPLNAYVELSAKLLPVVKSLMFGEPCSTVPLYKAPKL